MIREYQPSDLPAVERMFQAVGFNFKLPNMANPNMVVKLVNDDGEGPTMLIAGRRTLEAFILVDHKAKAPTHSYVDFLNLHDAGMEAGKLLGYDDVHAFLAPPIEKAFARRLIALGWHEPWKPYTREL